MLHFQWRQCYSKEYCNLSVAVACANYYFEGNVLKSIVAKDTTLCKLICFLKPCSAANLIYACYFTGSGLRIPKCSLSTCSFPEMDVLLTTGSPSFTVGQSCSFQIMCCQNSIDFPVSNNEKQTIWYSQSIIRFKSLLNMIVNSISSFPWLFMLWIILLFCDWSSWRKRELFVSLSFEEAVSLEGKCFISFNCGLV